MNDKPAYRIPQTWQWTELGDIVKIVRVQVTPQLTPKDKFNYLSIENVEANSGELVNFAPSLGESIKSAKIAFTTSDILYSKLRPYLNKVHLPNFDGISATDLIPLRPLDGIQREYLGYFLRTRLVVEYANQAMRGIQLPRIPVDNLLKLPVPLAPISEQGRIVHMIERAFAEIRTAKRALERIPDIIKQFRQSVLAKAFRGELTERDSTDDPADKLLQRIRFQHRKKWEEDCNSKGKASAKREYQEVEIIEDEGLPGLRCGWLWMRLGDLCSTSSGGTPLRSKNEYYGGEIPWLKSGELEDNLIMRTQETISQEGLKNSSAKIFPRDSVVIALYGATVGRTGVLGIDTASNQAVCAILNDESIINSKYLFYFLQSVRENLLAKRFGGAQPNISQEIIRQLELPLCSIQEQERVVEKIERLLAYAREVANSANSGTRNLTHLKESLLLKAFRGELVPQEPCDEPASILLERIKANRRAMDKRGKSQATLEMASRAKINPEA